MIKQPESTPAAPIPVMALPTYVVVSQKFHMFGVRHTIKATLLGETPCSKHKLPYDA